MTHASENAAISFAVAEVIDHARQLKYADTLNFLYGLTLLLGDSDEANQIRAAYSELATADSNLRQLLLPLRDQPAQQPKE